MILFTSVIITTILLLFFQYQALYFNRHYGKKITVILFGIIAIGFIGEIIYQILTRVQF